MNSVGGTRLRKVERKALAAMGREAGGMRRYV
jgi:hypothetical protein